MRPLKVAFIGARGIPARGEKGAGGIENYMEEVGSRLVERGHDVTVYCRSYYTKEENFYKGIRLRKLPTIPTKHLETFVHSFLGAMDASFKGFDIIQFHALGPSAFSFIPRIFGKTTLVSVRGLDWKREKWGRFAKWYLKKCEYPAVRFPVGTAVVSPVLKEYLESKFDVRVTFIPNGFRIPVHREPDLISNHGLSKDSYILFVGRLVPEKGCDLLIDAFKDIETDKKLVFAGEASYTLSYVEDLQKMANDRILFLGRVYGQFLEELYSNAFLFVLPSTIEGLSNSLLEAMSYGRCPLVSDIPENKVVVQENGVVFRNLNRADLREKLQILLEDEARVRLLGSLSKKYVESHFSWDRIVDMTESFYEGILNGKLRGSCFSENFSGTAFESKILNSGEL